MIKTALTINISHEDIASFTYLINKTQLGLLSSATQTIHIQTSHRPVQYIVGLKASESDCASGLKEQQKKLTQWQAFLPIFIQNGIRSLNDLLVKYQIKPDLMICFDQDRLQAWLPDMIGLYLLRDGQLLRMRSIEFAEPLFDADYHENHDFYSVQIDESDIFLMLPPELPSYFQSGEIADLLLGLRQLPAKMSELIRIARLRGFTLEATWFAIEVQRKEEDQKPVSEPGEYLYGRKRRRLNRAEANQDPWVDSVSESMSDSEESESRAPRSLLNQLLLNRQLKNKIIIASLLVIALIVALLIGQAMRPDPSTTSNTTTQPTTEPSVTIKPSATPSPVPTATPVPTQPRTELVVSAQRLNFRDAPSVEGTLLRTLTRGDVLVQLSEPEDDWVYVEADDGLTGYVYANYVTENTEP